MDAELPLSKEHGTNGRASHSDFHEVEVRDLDLVRDVGSMIPIIWQSWLFVQGDDKSSNIAIKIAGKDHVVHESEAILYWYLDQGYKIKVASLGTSIIGYIVYNWIFEGLMSIRMFYVMPEYLRTKAGIKLVNSTGKPNAVTFQTRKSIPPEEMFKVTRGRERKLFERDDLITWIMDWER